MLPKGCSSKRVDLLLLGSLEVVKDGEPQELPPSRKARALLAYLVATGRPHSRSSLCDIFWRDVSDPRAGLRWALSKIRSVVDVEDRRRIVASRDRIGFEAAGAGVDLDRVRREVPSAPSDASTEGLRRAAEAFRGEFLDGLDLSSCHRYETWCLGMRERLRSLHVSIRVELVDRLRADPEQALPHALHRLTLDPLAEDAYVAAIDLLGELGRIDRALELYEQCRTTLSTQLGMSPSEELDAARRRLETSRPRESGQDGTTERRGDAGEAGSGTDAISLALAGLPAPEGLPEIADGEPPLVGREAEMDELMTVVEQTAGGDGPSVALVTGEPGIGKTRLLRELVGRVRASGGWALSGPVFESEEIRPYGPWADMLRRLPDPLLDAESREVLSALLGAPARDRLPVGAPDRIRLFDRAVHVLERMAAARAPAVVVMDDIQWLDDASAALLHYLSRALRPTRLAFALAAREGEIEPASATGRLLRSLESAGRLRRISLRRLDAGQTEALVRAVHEDVDPAPVFATSEGNPFFALAVAASGRDDADRIPATIEEELRDRLDRLDPGPLSLLTWAAALGRAFDVPALARVSDRPAHEIVTQIDALERGGIFRVTGPDRYDFTHSLLREAAYHRLSAPARRTIHRRIARTLDGAKRGEGREPGAIAHHAERGGLTRLSVRTCVEAAEDSLWLHAFDEAAELVERGLSRTGDLPDPARLRLEMDLLRIYSFRSMRNRRPDDVEARVRRVTEEARDSGRTDVVAAGHAALVELQYQRGAFDEAGDSSIRTAEAGREGEPTTAVRALAKTAACLLMLDQAPDDARRLLDEASSLAAEHRMELATVALARALLHHHEGRLEPSLRSFREVIRLGRRAKDRWWEAAAMGRMIMVQLDRDDADAALRLARDAERVAARLDDEEEAVFARGLGAVARETVEGEPGPGAGGMESVDEALRELRELDTLWKIAHVQAYAAEVEIRRQRPDPARERVAEALEGGRTLERPSLMALCRGLLARCAAREGGAEAARRHLAAPEVTRPYHRLSHRARRVIARAREEAS